MDTKDPRVDMATVTLAQTLRLAALVFAFPLLFHAPPIATHASDWPLSLLLAAMAGACVTGLAFARFQFPAAWIMGPACIIALATASGLMEGQPHPALVNLGLGLLGASVGVKLGLTRNPQWARILLTILAAFAAMLAVSAVGVILAHYWLNLGWMTGFLALSPGGFEAMIAIAVAMNIDPALVSAAHVARIFALTLALPVLWRLVATPREPTSVP
jgi:uncharacterized protein